MAGRLVAAVDLGTTGVKAAVFDEAGALVRVRSADAGACFPRPGWAEQDARAWYELPCALLRETLAGEEAEAVWVSSQGISFVPVDADFSPLGAGLSWLDSRAEAETEALLSRVSAEEIARVTGKSALAAYTLPKLLWLRAHDRALFDRAAMFLMPMDYFLARASGRAVTDPTMAGGTMLYDLTARAWSERLMALAGITADRLAKVLPSGTAIGRVNAETARLSGLPERALVVNGAQDQKAAAYGARIAPGTATLSLGTAAALEALAEGDAQRRKLPVFPYVDGAQTVLEGCVNAGGAAIRWARDAILGGEGYDEMNALAARAPIGSGGVAFLPQLAGAGTARPGERRSGAFSGLTLSSGRPELLRAVYEGLACELRENVELARLSGARIERLNAFGGGAHSELLLEIIAGVCDLPVYASKEPETALLGAARMAAGAAGMDADAFGRPTDDRPINPANRGEYEEVFRRYSALMSLENRSR